MGSEEIKTAMLDDFEQSLMEGLEEVSDIATKTKLNIDETPAFITIIYRDTIAEYGIDTAFEALALIPGVELSMESTGAKQVIFRGIKEKGKIKLLVDGVPINNTYRGSMYHYLDFPAELIDRIEVIRGPGSVLYGSNAINAVINIITRSGSDLAGSGGFISTASYGEQKGGVLYTHLEDRLKFSVDAYAQNSNKQIDAGPDRSQTYEGKSYETLRDYSAGVAFEAENWKLLARTKNSTQGTAFGIANYLEQDTHRPGIENTTHFAELSYKTTAASLDLHFKVGHKQYDQYVDSTYSPNTAQGDWVYGLDYREAGDYIDISATTAVSGNHTLSYGIYADHTAAQLTDLFTYTEAAPGTPIIPSDSIIRPDVSRTITAAYIQSSYALNERLDILAGIRGDHFSDFGDSVSPRLAAVYALDEQTNIKMMYSRAFRAPSWIELYGSATGFSVGDDSLTAETADTAEIGIVTKKDIENLFRLNFFYTNVNEIIYRENTTYTQQGTSHLYGGELEYKKRLGLATTMTFNLSHTDGVDRKDEAITDIANQTANLRFGHKFQNRLISGTYATYVSPRKRADGDSRDDLEGYATLNQTLSYRYQNGLFISLSVKNLLDADIRYPAPAGTYQDDYPREGRTFWLKAAWEI